jgi:hypothetical protein
MKKQIEKYIVTFPKKKLISFHEAWTTVMELHKPQVSQMQQEKKCEVIEVHITPRNAQNSRKVKKVFETGGILQEKGFTDVRVEFLDATQIIKVKINNDKSSAFMNFLNQFKDNPHCTCLRITQSEDGTITLTIHNNLVLATIFDDMLESTFYPFVEKVA